MKLRTHITLDPPVESPTTQQLNVAIEGEISTFEKWLREKDVSLGREPSTLASSEKWILHAFMNFAHTREPE